MKSAIAAIGSTFALAATLCRAAPARAEDRYVAADGNDSNAGTKEAPFATVERAQAASSPGDTVYIRGGEYRFSSTSDAIGVELTKSGESGKPLRYFAYEGETPIFDFFQLRPQARVTGIDVRCNWIHVRGLEVRGVRQLVVGDSWSVRIRGDHNVIEQLHVHDGEAPGIFITSGASNLILNCDSHHNYDPLEQGGNADGFGCHSSGGDNVLRGCRAWENSDDGYDFINAPGTCTVEKSWAFRNGYIPDTNMTGANGAGFKSGGFGVPANVPASGVPRHVVRGCLAFGNRAIGFYANYHPGGLDFFNNTAFDNPANFDMRTTGGVTTTHKLRNNVAAMPGRDIVSWAGGSDEFNSWNSPVEVSNADFAGMDKAQALAPRRADGSLPDVALMHLVEGSDLIDKGEDVGMPFTGSKPDLGAFEFGEVTTVDPVDAGMPEPTPGNDAGIQMPTSGSGGSQARPPGSQPPPTQPPGTTSGAGGAPGVTPAGGNAPPPMTTGAPAPTPNTSSSDASSGSGCGCRITPAAPSSRLPLILVALLLWALLRRGGSKDPPAARPSRRRAGLKTRPYVKTRVEKRSRTPSAADGKPTALAASCGP
jgi:hypothetical protein